MRAFPRTRTARSRPEPADAGVGALFDAHAPMVLAICRYLLRDPQAAEDAAQETFLSAHRSLLRGTEPRDPPAWLATIARNECRRTRRKVRPLPLNEDVAGTMLDPADIVADRAELSEVADAIGKLPSRQREALVLREFCGLSYEQVAAAMSVSEPVVDSLLSRARRRVNERVGYVPRVARGALVVPASLREELARLIPGLDGAAAATATGVGGTAALAGLGSTPVAAKVAATGVAAVALALPVQATVRGDEVRRAAEGPAASREVLRAPTPPPAHRVLPAARARVTPPAPPRPATPKPRAAVTSRKVEPQRHDSSGPGSGHGRDSSGSGSSGSGESNSGSSGHGSGSSGSGSSGSGSGGTGSSGSGSGSSGPGSGGSGSVTSGSGSGSSGSGTSGASGSGSGTSGSGTSGPDSSGSGSGSSGSGSDPGGSGSSGSGSGGSGSGEPEPDDD